MLINSYELIRQASIFFHAVEVSDTRHTCIQYGKFYYIIRCRRGQWLKKMCCTENLTIMLHACQRPWLGCKKITYAKIHMVNYHADKVVSSRYYYHDYQYHKFLCASLQCLWKNSPPLNVPYLGDVLIFLNLTMHLFSQLDIFDNVTFDPKPRTCPHCSNSKPGVLLLTQIA